MLKFLKTVIYVRIEIKLLSNICIVKPNDDWLFTKSEKWLADMCDDREISFNLFHRWNIIYKFSDEMPK